MIRPDFLKSIELETRNQLAVIRLRMIWKITGVGVVRVSTWVNTASDGRYFPTLKSLEVAEQGHGAFQGLAALRRRSKFDLQKMNPYMAGLERERRAGTGR